jgi:hypothetical protein
MKKTIYKILVGLGTSLLLQASINAAPQHYPAADLPGNPNTLWRITFYDDTSNVHPAWGVQDICMIQTGVQGSNTVGRWYSTTYNNWIGAWRQEGDQVRMIGNFWGGKGIDNMNWEITATDKEGYGHWDEWVQNGSYGSWHGKGNTKMVKLGNCYSKFADNLSLPELDKLILEQATLAPRSIGKDGVEMAPIAAPIQ